MAKRRVIFVVYPGFELIDLAGPLSVFSAANDLSNRPEYELIVASPGGQAVGSRVGLSVSSTGLDGHQLGASDTVLVVGAHRRSLLAAMSAEPIKSVLRTASTSAERYGSVCAGAFVLASSGLLQGKRCATHWAIVDQLARYAREANVDSDALYVRDGRLWTSAGATAGVDMALSMVEADCGAKQMGSVAKWLVLYSRRPGHQSQFSTLLHAQSASDGVFAPLLDWLLSRLDRQTCVRDMASQVAMSERTFYRRFTQNMGMSPAKFLDVIRLDRAKDLLESGQSVKEVAAAVGFRSDAAFRSAFKASFGTTPSHYASMFRGGARSAAAEPEAGHP